MVRYLLEWTENGTPFAGYRDYPKKGDGTVTQFHPWTGEITGIQPVRWLHRESGLVWDQGRVDFPPSGSDYSRRWIGEVELDVFHKLCLLFESGVTLDRIWAEYGEAESGVPLEQIGAEYGE